MRLIMMNPKHYLRRTMLTGVCTTFLVTICILSGSDTTRRENGYQKTKLLSSRVYVNSSWKREHDRQMVLLVSRARSGSSFTSGVIAAHPGVFSFFEPLYPLNMMWQDERNMTKPRFHVWGDEMLQESCEWLDSFLQCNPGNMSAIHNILWENREPTSNMYECIDNKDLPGWDHLRCFLDMTQRCHDHPVTLIKTIRFRLRWTEVMMEAYPRLKVLYLVRDPRAVLHSQSRVFTKKWFDWYSDELHNVSKIYCSTLGEDIAAFKSLKKRFPLRIKLIRYEDGAMAPHEYTRSIYTFLNFNVTQEIAQYITSLTTKIKKHSPVKSRAFSIQRHDPLYEMQKWRYSAGFVETSVVDSHCGDVYTVLGYKTASSYKNLNSNESLVHAGFRDDHML